MFNVIDVLQSMGHEVIPFSVRYSQNHETPWASHFVDPIAGEDEVRFADHGISMSSLAKSIDRLFFSRDVYLKLQELIHETRPDVAYVMHYLRKLSPSVLKVLSDERVPAVVRLSDFQMLCPASHLMRNGRECRECIGGSVWPSVRHRCVKGSLALSILNWAAVSWQRRKGFFDLPFAYVCPSTYMNDILAAGGVSESRRFEIPTFVRAPLGVAEVPILERPRQLAYVGRIDQEKGVELLLEAFLRTQDGDDAEFHELHIAGDNSGHYARRLMQQYPSEAIKWLGMLDQSGVASLLAHSRVSVIPSLCPENLPNSLLESWSVGTPVVASRIGTLSAVVVEGETGFLFETGDCRDLYVALTKALRTAQLDKMSYECKRLAQERYSPEAHMESLLGLFEQAISHMGRS